MPIKVNRFFILAVVALLLSGCGIGFSCDEESPAVAAASALDSARLNRLYAAAERLFLHTPVRRDTRLQVSPIPTEFQDLVPVLLPVPPGVVSPTCVLLPPNGCRDPCLAMTSHEDGKVPKPMAT